MDVHGDAIAAQLVDDVNDAGVAGVGAVFLEGETMEEVASVQWAGGNPVVCPYPTFPTMT
jgi:hypothetical protein